MDEYADIPLDRFGRIFFSLVAYDFLWFGYLAGPMYKQFAQIPHRVAALMVYLLVGYALAFGTTGGYLHNLVWCASVAVLVWGTFNCVMLNIVSDGWTREMAIGDTLAGIVNCCIAGAVATSMCPVWYPLVTIVGVLGFLAVMKLLETEPASGTGLQGAILLSNTPSVPWAHSSGSVAIKITIATSRMHRAGTEHSAKVRYMPAKGFTVAFDGVLEEYSGETYRAALLSACQAHDRHVASVSCDNAKLDDVTIDQIKSTPALRAIKATG